MTRKVALGKEFLQLLIDAGLISPLATRVTISADLDGILEIEEERRGTPEWLTRLGGADLSEFARLQQVEQLAAKMVELQNEGQVDDALAEKVASLIGGTAKRPN